MGRGKAQSKRQMNIHSHICSFQRETDGTLFGTNGGQSNLLPQERKEGDGVGSVAGRSVGRTDGRTVSEHRTFPPRFAMKRNRLVDGDWGLGIGGGCQSAEHFAPESEYKIKRDYTPQGAELCCAYMHQTQRDVPFSCVTVPPPSCE